MTRQPRPLKARASDVDVLRATYRAQASCHGETGTGRCAWQPQFPLDDRDVRRQAREHVARLPGHEVSVTVADVARYYLPNHLVSILTAPEPEEGQTTGPDSTTETKED